MIRAIEPMLRALANCFPRLAARAMIALRLPITSNAVDWSSYLSEPHGWRPINDLPVAFAVRVIIERRYKTVVEIGAYDGSRPIALKRLFPEIEVYALDIQDGFRVRTSYGVKFRKFDLDFIASLQNAAVIANRVMCCMTTQELRGFLKACASSKSDIIFHELTPVFQTSRTIKRSPGTLYHDLKYEFDSAGYELLGTRDAGQVGQFDINFYEFGYFNVASPAPRRT